VGRSTCFAPSPHLPPPPTRSHDRTSRFNSMFRLDSGHLRLLPHRIASLHPRGIHPLPCGRSGRSGCSCRSCHSWHSCLSFRSRLSTSPHPDSSSSASASASAPPNAAPLLFTLPTQQPLPCNALQPGNLRLSQLRSLQAPPRLLRLPAMHHRLQRSLPSPHKAWAALRGIIARIPEPAMAMGMGMGMVTGLATATAAARQWESDPHPAGESGGRRLG
jgi:hypothetical protein